MPAKPNRIKQFFTEHMVLKVMALILATLVIYTTRNITSRTEDFEIPIVVDVDEGVAILQQDVKTAYITCRGSHDDLRRLDLKDLKVVVEPKSTGIAGGERIPIGTHNVKGWTRGVKIIKVRPHTVFVNYDLEVEKSIGVAMPETVGKPLLGKAEVTYDPKIVTIKGPRSKLESLKILRTEPIDVEGAVGSFNMKLKILDEERSGVWHIEPAEVTAHINIVTKSISKSWKNIKVLALVDNNCSKNLEFSPELVDVSLHGSPQAINSIAKSEISIFVNCSDIKTVGIHKITAEIHIPQGLNISAAIDPPIINVTRRPDTPPEEQAVKTGNLNDNGESTNKVSTTN
jgi:hypothetical protein